MDTKRLKLNAFVLSHIISSKNFTAVKINEAVGKGI